MIATAPTTYCQRVGLSTPGFSSSSSPILSSRDTVSAHRALHEGGDLRLGRGIQRLHCERRRPHLAVVERGLVAEAERRVARLELLRVLEEAQDVAIVRVGGHPVPEARYKARRGGHDDRVNSLTDYPIFRGHRSDLRQH